MLRVQQDITSWVASMYPVTRRIRREDPDLARQLRRSSSGVALNVSEGTGARGGLRLKAYRIALAEMRESMGALELARAAGFIGTMTPSEDDRMQKILATLINLARPWEA